MNFEKYLYGIKKETVQAVTGYLDIPEEKRESVAAFRKRARINQDVLSKIKTVLMLKREYEVEHEREMLEIEERLRKEQIRQIQENLSLMNDDDAIGTIRDYFKKPENRNKWLKGTLDAAAKGNANSQRLIAQILDAVVEKSEVQIDLSASQYSAIREEARKRAEQLCRETNGNRGLLTEPVILSDKVRQNSR